MSVVFHPLEALDRWFEKDGNGVDIFYPLTLFFAFGIWLVFERYHRMHNSAVPFEWKIPEARSFHLHLSPRFSDAILVITGSRSQVGIQTHSERESRVPQGGS
jgi:hypothetical protein